MNTQALYRFHIGLDTRTGEPTSTHQRLSARAILDHAYPDGFTLQEVEGLWRGTREPAWIVEVYGDASELAHVRAADVAREIKRTMDQDAVGLAVMPVNFRLL